MVDETVKLSEVVDGLGEEKGDGGGGTGNAPAATSPPPHTPPPQSPPPQSPPPYSPPGQKLEPTLENVRSIWSQVVNDARGKTPLLGSLLAESEVAAVEGRDIMVRPGHAVHAEGLERQGETIAQLVGRYISEAPRIKIIEQGAVRTAASPPSRMTAEGATAERLKTLRAKDPTLSAAVDALDLELLE